MIDFMEARGGIEPPHKGFADPPLSTWVPRPEHFSDPAPHQNDNFRPN
jgi:hypothetical protein